MLLIHYNVGILFETINIVYMGTLTSERVQLTTVTKLLPFLYLFFTKDKINILRIINVNKTIKE